MEQELAGAGAGRDDLDVVTALRFLVAYAKQHPKVRLRTDDDALSEAALTEVAHWLLQIEIAELRDGGEAAAEE